MATMILSGTPENLSFCRPEGVVSKLVGDDLILARITSWPRRIPCMAIIFLLVSGTTMSCCGLAGGVGMSKSGAVCGGGRGGGGSRGAAGDVGGANPAGFAVGGADLQVIEPFAEDFHLFGAAELAEFFKRVGIFVEHDVGAVGAAIGEGRRGRLAEGGRSGGENGDGGC